MTNGRRRAMVVVGRKRHVARFVPPFPVQWAILLVRSLVSWVQFLDMSLFFLSFIMTIKCKVI